ncbi:MAG: hypothetical protein ACF8GE_09700 [Phycisphaerales bacterium JB043]
MGADLTVVCCAAPEDLRAGQYVTVVNEKFEFYPWRAASECDTPPTRTILVDSYPNDPVVPMRIESVCLPFVHARSITGKPLLLDIRFKQLVLVDDAFARGFAKAVRSYRKRRKNESRSDSSAHEKKTSKKH